MQRSTSVAVGLLVVAAIAIAIFVSRAQPSRSAAPVRASASASASAAPSASASASAAAGDAEPAPLEEIAGEGYDLLPDGKKAPPLPDSAPQTVSFGVILFTYQGAQSAPASARTKDAARQKAAAIAAEAKQDFSAAVAKGDRGSTANAGRVPRGILEPAAEYLLFTLPKGEVSAEPVDTPRGYWVLRRID